MIKIKVNKYQRLEMTASGGELPMYAGNICQMNDSLYVLW